MSFAAEKSFVAIEASVDCFRISNEKVIYVFIFTFSTFLYSWFLELSGHFRLSSAITATSERFVRNMFYLLMCCDWILVSNQLSSLNLWRVWAILWKLWFYCIGIKLLVTLFKKTMWLLLSKQIRYSWYVDDYSQLQHYAFFLFFSRWPWISEQRDLVYLLKV